VAYMTNGKRDYKKELAWEHKKKPNRVKERVARNKARSDKGLKVGDSRQVDHKDSNPHNNNKSNLQVVSASYNLRKEANRKKFKSRKT
tara:strand:+ start:865 stop:1128 length:264 start_codon:yes stop_codon:yes gene_type:complete